MTRAALAAAAAMALAFSGCGSGGATGDGDRRTVVVFAAASLTQAFTRIAADFQTAHPGVRVQLAFDGSAALVSRLREGARADVLATADPTTMAAATGAGLVHRATVFATNTLVLITPAGNPARITGLDASLNGRKLVVCAPVVPCGNATAKLAASVGVRLRPVSMEQKVTDVRTKVESGEADAGVVYRTDARSAGERVTTVEIARATSVVNSYPIALTRRPAGSPADAQAFADAVLSNQGRGVLTGLGFGGAVSR